MLKILPPSEIRKLDQYTIEHEPIGSYALMKRACSVFVEAFVRDFPGRRVVHVVCGTGNNGGDGLVIAGKLAALDYPVKVWVVAGKESDDFEKAKGELGLPILQADPIYKGMFKGCDVLIDAIFGSGLSRPLEGMYARVVTEMNATHALKLAVDMPSGLLANSSSEGTIFQAGVTYTFQLPKLALMFPESAKYAGNWKALDIGLSQEYLERVACRYFYVQKADIAGLFRPRAKFDHKGTFGHALMIAGSKGKMGAAILAGKAALRAGVGLLTAHVPTGGVLAMHTALPEAMVDPDQHADHFTSIGPMAYSAIGVGPGLGTHHDTEKAMAGVLKSGLPCVLDADALNIIAANNDLEALIPKGSILTPHVKEFARWAGDSKNSFAQLERLSHKAEKTSSVVVLKGAHTAIAFPDGRIFFNATGNSGMATAGSGDVLTGILTALLSHGYDSETASLLGVYMHGKAGDLACEGKISIIASDIIEKIPSVALGF